MNYHLLDLINGRFPHIQHKPRHRLTVMQH